MFDIAIVFARALFSFLVYKKKDLSYFGIVIFWVGGKNCIVKNENYRISRITIH